MNTKKTLLSVSIALALLGHNPSALAQNNTEPLVTLVNESKAAPSSEDTIEIEVEELVVTGTRITGGIESAPLVMITADDIELRGITDIDQLFRQITTTTPTISASNPAGINGNLVSNRGRFFNNTSAGTSINLRGLGAGSTLVLLNGRRLAGEAASNGDFADISGIPVSSIERVEILTSGASAVYGADAVAGVVNIILKKDYKGFSSNVRLENSESGADLQRYNLTFGSSWESGNLTTALSYVDQKQISAREFGITTLDFRDLGGSDFRELTSTRGVFSLIDDGFADDSDGFGNDALLLPVNAGPVDFSSDPSEFERVPRDSVAERLPVALSPTTETISLSARLSQSVNNNFVDTFFADLFYSRRNTETAVETPAISVDGIDALDSDFGSPFLSEDVLFSLDLSDVVGQGIIPNDFNDTKSENVSISTGFSGSLSSSWDWESAFSYSLNEDQDIRFTTDALNALFGQFDDDTFEIIEEPFNLVRGDYLTNPEAQAALQRNSFQILSDDESEIISFTSVLRGELFEDRKNGALRLSLGLDYREQENQQAFLSISADGQRPGSQRDLDATRTTTALFSEASIGLSPTVQLDAALRWEETENEGTSVRPEDALAVFEVSGGINQFEPINGDFRFNQADTGISPRLGLSWEVNDSLKLRVTTGQSFRSPNAQEVGEAAAVSAGFEDAIDPITGELLDRFDVPQVRGGNARLRQETADTLNLGIDYDSQLGEHFIGTSLDYFQIDYEDRISSSFEFINDSFLNRPLREQAIVRDDSGNALYIYNGPINIAEQNTSGIDFKLTHQYVSDSWSLNSDLGLTHQLSDEQRGEAGGEVEDLLGITAPETRANLISTLGFSDFQITGVLNYTGSYEQRIFFGTAQTEELSRDTIEDFTTFDLQVEYTIPESNSWLSQTSIKVGANNLFDTDPPFLNRFNGFDGSFYNLRRRIFYIDLSKNF